LASQTYDDVRLRGGWGQAWPGAARASRWRWPNRQTR